MAATITSTMALDTSPAMRDVQAFANRAQKQLNSIKLGGGNFSHALGTMSRSVSEFNKSLEASNARVLAFGASAGIIYSVNQAFRSLISTTIDVEKSLADINVILNLNSGNLRNFKDELFAISRQTAQSFGEVAKAATEFSRQGLGMEETLKRTRDALILTRLSGLDAVASTEALTAAVNSFSDAALSSTQIINKLATVDAAFAVSSADLAEAIKRVGSTAQDAGVDMDQLIGIVTSVQQTTARGGAVIGNAFKTIFQRINRPEVIAQLEQLGVSVRDASGQIKPVLSIVEDLSKKIDGFSEATKSQIEQSVASVYQINILKATLADLSKEYSVYNKAREISAGADQEAIRRNEELNNTLAALVSKTKTNLAQLASSIGEATLNPLADRFLGAFNSMAEGLSSKNTEGLGSTLGKGIMDGIGEFISGPGAILLAAVVTKLVVKFSKDVREAFSSLLGFEKGSREILNIQSKIHEILRQNPQLVAAVFDKTNQLVSSEQKLAELQTKVLSTLHAENVERAQALALSKQLAAQVLATGQKATILGPPSTKKASGGLIPNFANKTDQMQEIMGAIAGGYQPGDVRQMNVKGLGQVTYNSAEKVKDFGLGQPAIMPPPMSDAGRDYRRRFKEIHGFNPYAAGGLIPNFAKIRGRELGEGVFGRFFDTGKSIGGVPVGKKVFYPTDLVQNSIRREYRNSEDLLKAPLPKIVQIPKLIGSLERSLQRKTLGKEVIKGVTANDFVQSLPKALQGKADKVLSAASIYLEDNILKQGIKPNDLHFENFMLNSAAINGFKELIKNPAKYKAFKDGVGRESFYNDIAEQGGRLAIIDPGEFRKIYANGLLPAIGRELDAGIPKDKIRVGSSPSLSSNMNPYGLGVYNTQDEPMGLNQGIRRALTSGLNPKTHGAAQGLVPNFANRSFEFDEKRFKQGYEEQKSYNIFKTSEQETKKGFTEVVNEKWKQQKQLLREGKITQKQAIEKAESLVKGYALASDEMKYFVKSIQATTQSQKAIEKLQKEKIAKPQGKIGEILSNDKRNFKGFNQFSLLPESVYTAPKPAVFNPASLAPQSVINPQPKPGITGRSYDIPLDKFLAADSKRILKDGSYAFERYESINPTTKSGMNKAFNPEKYENVIQGEIKQELEKVRSKIRSGMIVGVDKATQEIEKIAKNYGLVGTEVTKLRNFVKETVKTQKNFETDQRKLQNRISKDIKGGQLGLDFQGRPLFNGNNQGEFGSILGFAEKQDKKIKAGQKPEAQVLAQRFAQAAKDKEVLHKAKERDVILKRNISEALHRQQQVGSRFSEAEGIKSAGSLSSLIPFTQTRRNALELKSTNREAFKQARTDLTNRFQNRALGASFAFPLLGNVAQQAIGTDTQGQRVAGSLAGAVGNIGSFAAGGAMFGPQGAAIGAAIGAASSLPDVITAIVSELPEFQKRLEAITDSVGRSAESMSLFLQASEKLDAFASGKLKLSGDERAQRGVISRLESQRLEALAKLSPERAKALGGAKSTEERISISEGFALEDARKLQRAEANTNLENFKTSSKFNSLSFGLLANKFLTKDESDLEGFRSLVNGETISPNDPRDKTAFTPIFGNKLSQEGESLFAPLKSSILSSKGKNDNGTEGLTLFETLVKSTNGLEEKVEKARNAPDTFFKFLSDLAKQTKNSEAQSVIGGIINLEGENGKQAREALVKSLSQFSKEQVEIARNSEKLFKQNNQTRIQTSSKFEDALLDAIIAINSFQAEIEKVNALALQKFSAITERENTRGNAFIAQQEFFSGPLTIAALQEKVSVNQIEQRNRAGRLQADANRNVSLSALFNDQSASFLKGSFNAATEGGLFDLSENQRQAFDFSNLGNIAESIQKKDFAGALKGFEDNFGPDTISKRLDALRAKGGGGGLGLTREETQQKDFLANIKEGLPRIFDEHTKTIELLDAAKKEELATTKILTESQRNLINIQRKLAVGGGPEGLLSDEFGINRSIANANVLRSRPGNFSDTKGLLQIADTIQHLGGKIDENLESSLTNGLAKQIEESFKAAGMVLTRGSFQDIASTQVRNRFKTDDESETQKLLTKFDEFFPSLKEVSASLEHFVDAALGGKLSVNINPSQSSSSTGGISGTGSPSRAALLSRANQPAETELQKEFRKSLSKIRQASLNQPKEGADLPKVEEFEAEQRNVPANSGYVASLTESLEIEEKLRRVTSDESKAREAILALQTRISDLRKEDFNSNKSALEIEREAAVAEAEIVKSLAEQAYQRSEITGAQAQQIQNALSIAKLEQGSYGLKDTMADFSEGLKYNSKDFFTDLHQGAQEMSAGLKSSFKDAFRSFTDGSKSAKEAWRDFAMSVLGRITDKTSSIAIDSLFNLGRTGVSAGISAFQNRGASSLGGYALPSSNLSYAAKGGIIKRFSSGGPVLGGSGTRDDIPALLTDGEYVLRRSAVDKIGIENLNAINGFSASFANRYSYDNELRPTKGTKIIDSILSAEALDDPNNPMNALRDSREAGLTSYLEEKKAYEKMKKDAMKAYERQINQTLIGAYISAATTVGAAGIQAGIASRAASGAGTTYGVPSSVNKTSINSQQLNNVLDGAKSQRLNLNSFRGIPYANGAAMGGIIRKYASGGSVFGGNSSSDNIPAMLMGGEYVIRKDVVQKRGKGFFDRLNSGQVPRFANGGLVGSDAAALNGGDSGGELSEAVSRLIEITESISQSLKENKSKEQKTDVQSNNKGDAGNGTITNNFSFNITVNQDGNIESSSSGGQSQDAKKNNSDTESFKRLSEMIQGECVKTLVKESRPGGILAEMRKR